MPSKNNSERIQEIISSSTAPEVPIKIVNVNGLTKNKAKPTKEFVVVKIPKNPFMIHQVTTTSKYYIRNNTTTKSYVYEPFEMKENEIALRYENRYRAKQEQISFLEQKEKQIVKELNWNAYILFSVVPHVRIPNSIKVTRESFKDLFLNEKNSVVIYNDLPGEISATSSIPNSDGRSSDPHTVRRDYFEINDDLSVHFCRRISGEHKLNMYHPMFVAAPLLHLAKRVYDNAHYFGGASFRVSVNGSIQTASSTYDGREIPNGGRTVSDFPVQHEIPHAILDVKNEFLKIFEKYFEALHIDYASKIFKDTVIKTVLAGLDASDSRLKVN